MNLSTKNYDKNLSRKFAISELTPESAADLKNAGFPFGIRELYPPLSQRILQARGLVPRVNRLVAYDTEGKHAVGFLCLIEDNASIYSIKFVFVDPKFRKKGVASTMFNFALNLAKNKGARKVYLEVEDWNSNVVTLYEKLGFKIIGTRMAGQGYLENNSRLRVVTSTLRGKGYFTNFSYKEIGQLIKLQTKSKKNKELLFDIYNRCLDNSFLAFFELNSENIINGYSQMWKHFCFKDVLINKQVDSYALIFNRPSFSNATIEVNSISPRNIPFILNDVSKILDQKGMGYAHISLFNVADSSCAQWFKDKGLKLFNFSTMGITL